MKKFLLLSIFLLSTHIAFADTANQRKLAAEIFQVMGTDKQMQAMFEQMKNMQLQQIKQSASKENAEQASQMVEKMNQVLQKNFTWDKLKEKYIDIYTEVFSEEDLTGLITFYKSPVGQKFIEKMPELMMKGMKIGQETMMEMKPEIDKMMKEEMSKSQPVSEMPKTEKAPAAIK